MNYLFYKQNQYFYYYNIIIVIEQGWPPRRDLRATKYINKFGGAKIVFFF